MTPSLDAHLSDMQDKSLLAATLIDALQLTIPQAEYRKLSFEIVDALAEIANELNMGLDSTVLSRVESKTEDAA